jgi:hypothetical protein
VGRNDLAGEGGFSALARAQQSDNTTTVERVINAFEKFGSFDHVCILP